MMMRLLVVILGLVAAGTSTVQAHVAQQAAQIAHDGCGALHAKWSTFTVVSTAMTDRFVVSEDDGSTVNELCPGKTYNVKVSTRDSEGYFLSASEGSFNAASKCLSSEEPTKQVEATLTVPCSASGILKLTMMTKKADQRLVNSAVFVVDNGCAATACAASQAMSTIRRMLQDNSSADNSSADNSTDGGDYSGDGEDVAFQIRLMKAHGALMIVAFLFAMPTAILIARHRRMIPNKKIVGKDIWFWMHILFQMLAVAAFIAGIVIAIKEFGTESDSDAWSAHRIIGILLIALIGVQVLFGAFLRPAPDSRIRWAFNMVHHNWGRLVLVLAWINIGLGIYLYNYEAVVDDTDTNLHVPWTIATVVIFFVLMLITIILEVVDELHRQKSLNKVASQEFSNISGSPSPTASKGGANERV